MRGFGAGLLTGLALTWAFACGGGSDAQLPPQEPVLPRPDLYLGYFGDVNMQETLDHTNLVWIYGWPDGSIATVIQHLLQAQRAGKKAVLAVDATDEARLRYFLTQLQGAGALAPVVAFYPQDEPDIAGISDEDMTRQNDLLRAVAPSYFQHVPAVAVIYGNTGRTPGLASFDWVGRDNYGAGPQFLPLLPHQRLLLIPGGANPWREDPAPHVAACNARADCIAVIGFLWDWPQPGQGIGVRGNGMAARYREVFGSH